jgi:hypothetical protein
VRAVDAAVARRQAGELGAAPDDGPLLERVGLEDLLEAVLRDEEPVRVTGAPRPGVERHR